MTYCVINLCRNYKRRLKTPKTISYHSCILPDYPAHGSYNISTNIKGAGPGNAYELLVINVTCHDGYVPNRKPLVSCSYGEWSGPMPQCVSSCRLNPHPSVEYRCRVPAESAEEERFRPCNTFEPAGTLVKPVCQPLYEYPGANFGFMECKNGEWTNFVKKCSPVCGILASKPAQLILNGSLDKHDDVPWHSSIYLKTSLPYKLICGGSLISSNRVISAAHCFWGTSNSALHPASHYVVAFGKLHQDFDSKLDDSQWSNGIRAPPSTGARAVFPEDGVLNTLKLVGFLADRPYNYNVESIKVPSYYGDDSANFQSDIAVIQLSTNIEFRPHIRPVCVDYDRDFEKRQLQPGNKGKVAGWGFTSQDGQPAQELRVVDLPFVSLDKCFKSLPESFTSLITNDKICAGYEIAGTSVCHGDSGSGLAFPEVERGVARYYLRGVVSTAPPNEYECNTNTYTTFTRIIKHEEFLKLYTRD